MTALHWLIEPLGQHHDRAAFSCGVDALDRYLKQYARQDMRRRVTAVFVAAPETTPTTVAGYYTLAAASVSLAGVPPATARRLPHYENLPAVLLGRLAVDRQWQGQRLGARLLADALMRSRAIRGSIGALFLVVDALDDDAARYYERFGFQRFHDRPQRLFLSLDSAFPA